MDKGGISERHLSTKQTSSVAAPNLSKDLYDSSYHPLRWVAASRRIVRIGILHSLSFYFTSVAFYVPGTPAMEKKMGSGR